MFSSFFFIAFGTAPRTRERSGGIAASGAGLEKHPPLALHRSKTRVGRFRKTE